MKRSKSQNQHQRPDHSRRSLFGRLAALAAGRFGARLTAAAHAPSIVTACPINLEDVRPDQLTLDDAWRIVSDICGVNEDPFGGTDEEVLALLWRFHTLPPDEAAAWLKGINDRLGVAVEKWRVEFDARTEFFEKGGVL
jgi:hypothetical protein